MSARASPATSADLAAAPGRRPIPGDALLQPLALGAIAVLLLNDHVFKAVAPGLVTGKLSDIAGLVFFPLLLVAVAELALARAGTLARAGRAARHGGGGRDRDRVSPRSSCCPARKRSTSRCWGSRSGRFACWPA